MPRVGNRARVCATVALCGLAVMCAPAQTAQNSRVSIRRVAVLGGNDPQEFEISSSQPVSPTVLVLTGPDRLVVDFPNAIPDVGLRNISINRGEVRGVRVGLFMQDPPITRVVLDLKSPQQYQIFPSGKTVIVKLGAGASTAAVAPRSITPVAAVSPAPAPARASYAPVITPPRPKPRPRVDVEFQNGKLTIWAEKASLAEVLSEVHNRTGAEIPIPPGADQEQVVANFGPGAPRDVLTALLNGSRFNFILVGSDRDASQVKSVILTARGEGVSQPAIEIPSSPVAQSDPEPPPQENPPEPPPEALPAPQ
jgi:hypothetical protein